MIDKTLDISLEEDLIQNMAFVCFQEEAYFFYIIACFWNPKPKRQNFSEF